MPDYFYDNIFQDPSSYLILPILINIILIVSNLLAAWGSIISCHILIIPWLALYFAYILFVFGLLLYMVVLLYHIWFKIVLFLIVSPILIICIIFWLTLLEHFFSIKMKSKKKKARMTNTRNPHPVFPRPMKNVNFAPPPIRPAPPPHPQPPPHPHPHHPPPPPPGRFTKHHAPTHTARNSRMGSKQRSGKKHKQRREENSKAVESSGDSRHSKQYHKPRVAEDTIADIQENNYSLKTVNTNHNSKEVSFKYQYNSQCKLSKPQPNLTRLGLTIK